MANSDVYGLCCQYHGKKVRIRCHDGKIHSGRITRVTKSHVWIEPSGSWGGFGLGYYGGYGYRYGYRSGYPIALSFVAGVALAAAFFW